MHAWLDLGAKKTLLLAWITRLRQRCTLTRLSWWLANALFQPVFNDLYGCISDLEDRINELENNDHDSDIENLQNDLAALDHRIDSLNDAVSELEQEEG